MATVLHRGAIYTTAGRSQDAWALVAAISAAEGDVHAEAETDPQGWKPVQRALEKVLDARDTLLGAVRSARHHMEKGGWKEEPGHGSPEWDALWVAFHKLY